MSCSQRGFSGFAPHRTHLHGYHGHRADTTNSWRLDGSMNLTWFTYQFRWETLIVAPTGSEPLPPFTTGESLRGEWNSSLTTAPMPYAVLKCHPHVCHGQTKHVIFFVVWASIPWSSGKNQSLSMDWVSEFRNSNSWKMIYPLVI